MSDLKDALIHQDALGEFGVDDRDARIERMLSGLQCITCGEPLLDGFCGAHGLRNPQRACTETELLMRAKIWRMRVIRGESVFLAARERLSG